MPEHLTGRPPREGHEAPVAGRVLVLWNPRAGSGDRARRRTDLERALDAHQIDAEIVESPSEQASSEHLQAALSASHTEAYRAVVAAGGDGTVLGIAIALLGHHVPLGVLPMGTAMNFARSLDLPLDLDEAAGVLATGEARDVDVGEARGQSFFEIASIGATAVVLAGATEAEAGRFRRALDLLRRAVRYRRTRIRLQLDGREVRARAQAIAIANGRFAGRGLELAPDARLDDGRFDVLVFEGQGLGGLVRLFVRLLLGRTGAPRIRRYRAVSVSISSHRPLPVRVDSRDLGVTPVVFVTRRGALRVISPTEPEARS